MLPFKVRFFFIGIIKFITTEVEIVCLDLSLLYLNVNTTKEQFGDLNMGKCLQFSWDGTRLFVYDDTYNFERAHLLSIVSRAGSVRPLCTVRRRSSFLSACNNASRINNKAIYPRLRWKIMKVLIAQYPFSLVRMKYWDLLDQCPWGNIRPTNRHDSFQYYTTV